MYLRCHACWSLIGACIISQFSGGSILKFDLPWRKPASSKTFELKICSFWSMELKRVQQIMLYSYSRCDPDIDIGESRCFGPIGTTMLVTTPVVVSRAYRSRDWLFLLLSSHQSRPRKQGRLTAADANYMHYLKSCTRKTISYRGLQKFRLLFHSLVDVSRVFGVLNTVIIYICFCFSFY